MVLTSTLCGAKQFESLSKGDNDYAADSSVLILDSVRNAIEMEIGSSIMFVDIGQIILCIVTLAYVRRKKFFVYVDTRITQFITKSEPKKDLLLCILF